jgi:pSer/pThr/pTyr-binding forkhead associated (FHA) protein
MILKRLGIFSIIVVVGIGAGMLLIDFLCRKMGLSRGISDFIIVLYAGIFIIISLMMGRDIPKEPGESGEIVLPSEREKESSRFYAWLNPSDSSSKAGFPITRKLMTIGREVHADILINDPSVSKKHAQILSLPGGFLLKDLESSNGTFINNKRIDETYLADGDLVLFGEAKFHFSCAKVKEVTREAEVTAIKDAAFDSEDVSTGTQSKSGSRLRDLSDRGKIPSPPERPAGSTGESGGEETGEEDVSAGTERLNKE